MAWFLGAGKTTFLRHRLASAGADAPRTAVLVNGFSAVGVDGALLRERGADVVELPKGCICCSPRKNLAQQLKSGGSRSCSSGCSNWTSSGIRRAALLSGCARP